MGNVPKKFNHLTNELNCNFRIGTIVSFEYLQNQTKTIQIVMPQICC